MSKSHQQELENQAGRIWKIGVRGRLLFAFLAITGFAVLAAAAGLFAFGEVGGRLYLVDTRIPPTLSALELSRSAERIIGAAPALLAATDRNRRDETKAAVAAEVARLRDRLSDLRRYDPELPALRQIEPVAASLTARLAALETLVALRLDASSRVEALRGSAFGANEETQRLLSPWLQVVAGQISAIVEDRQAGFPDLDDLKRLASHTRTLQLLQTAQSQVSSVADMLAEASTTSEEQRLAVLAFQLGLTLRDLQAAAAGLDPRLSPLFLDQVAALRQLSEGGASIIAARQQELSLVHEGEELIADIASLSAQLTAAVDGLGAAAKRDINEAIGDALSVQRLSTRALAVVVALSVLTSVLIVWLYVGRNLARRLTVLSDGMLAIAGGNLRTPVPVTGDDEIAAMGRAVETFRLNTLERDGLLEERAQAADRLEEEVRHRTAELARSVAEVEEKSRQLESANQFKGRFLASASHDLRQPLHALNLLVAQLRAESKADERSRLVGRINAAVNSMNELLDALLDMSKLDAGVLEPDLREFPVQPLLTRMETTFAEAVREKGLRLHIAPTGSWARSDFILLERILLNLVSNAVRYTSKGGVVVGCRRRGDRLRIDVCDSGAGIPEEQQRAIFREFVQLPNPDADRRGGLGLGLSIVDRLSRLLDHPIELASSPGGGSRFSIVVPAVTARSERGEMPSSVTPLADALRGKRVVLIDDDPRVLDAMAGLLGIWRCDVIAASAIEPARRQLQARQLKPDLIISDYRLANGQTGIEPTGELRGAFGTAIPALLISADTTPEVMQRASAGGYHLLHKPVAPMRLRAMLNHLLKDRETPDASGAVQRLRPGPRLAGARDQVTPPR